MAILPSWRGMALPVVLRLHQKVLLLALAAAFGLAMALWGAAWAPAGDFTPDHGTPDLARIEQPRHRRRRTARPPQKPSDFTPETPKNSPRKQGQSLTSR